MKITAKNTLGQADSGNNEGSYSNALSSLGERATGQTVKMLNKHHYKHIGITHQGSEDIILTPNQLERLSQPAHAQQGDRRTLKPLKNQHNKRIRMHEHQQLQVTGVESCRELLKIETDQQQTRMKHVKRKSQYSRQQQKVEFVTQNSLYVYQPPISAMEGDGTPYQEQSQVGDKLLGEQRAWPHAGQPVTVFDCDSFPESKPIQNPSYAQLNVYLKSNGKRDQSERNPSQQNTSSQGALEENLCQQLAQDLLPSKSKNMPQSKPSTQTTYKERHSNEAPELSILFQQSIMQKQLQVKPEPPTLHQQQEQLAQQQQQVQASLQRVARETKAKKAAKLLAASQKEERQHPAVKKQQKFLEKHDKTNILTTEKQEEKEKATSLPPAQKYFNPVYNQQKLRSLKWFNRDRHGKASSGDYYESLSCDETNDEPYNTRHVDQRNVYPVDQDIKEQALKRREVYEKYNQFSKEILSQTTEARGYKYLLAKGNNQALLARVLQKRPSWTPIAIDKGLTSLFDFKWTPYSQNVKFDLLNKHGHKALVNHFEYHQCLSQKDLLFTNLKKACELNHKDLLDYLPMTFVIDLTNRYQLEMALEQFTHCFNAVERHKTSSVTAINQQLALLQQRGNKTPLVLRPSMFDGLNLWVLKPNDANRGRGVQVFNKLDDVKKQINDCLNGATQDQTLSDQKPQPQPQQTDQPKSILKSDLFVIQKYIEKPLLIRERKFDIRLWVLITHEHECYLFEEGYIRMSSYKYTLDESSIDNRAVHLTNNAVQKKDQAYGKLEDGNQLSFAEAEEITGVDFRKITKTKIRESIEVSLMATRQKINKLNRKYCFEIFGYDFMIDEEMHPWLIEVNTNPCLEESSNILRQFLPRMIDDALKLTLDVIYPPLRGDHLPEQTQDEDTVVLSQSESFSVDGYDDDTNMWGERIYKFRPPPTL